MTKVEALGDDKKQSAIRTQPLSLLHLFGHRARFLLEKLKIEQWHGNQRQDRGSDGRCG